MWSINPKTPVLQTPSQADHGKKRPIEELGLRKDRHRLGGLLLNRRGSDCARQTFTPKGKRWAGGPQAVRTCTVLFKKPRQRQKALATAPNSQTSPDSAAALGACPSLPSWAKRGALLDADGALYAECAGGAAPPQPPLRACNPLSKPSGQRPRWGQRGELTHEAKTPERTTKQDVHWKGSMRPIILTPPSCKIDHAPDFRVDSLKSFMEKKI